VLAPPHPAVEREPQHLDGVSQEEGEVRDPEVCHAPPRWWQHGWAGNAAVDKDSLLYGAARPDLQSFGQKYRPQGNLFIAVRMGVDEEDCNHVTAQLTCHVCCPQWGGCMWLPELEGRGMDGDKCCR
jgi:hypothetical protein